MTKETKRTVRRTLRNRLTELEDRFETMQKIIKQQSKSLYLQSYKDNLKRIRRETRQLNDAIKELAE